VDRPFVVLRRAPRQPPRILRRSYAEELLLWAVDHFQARWLSTRAQNGDIEEVQRAIAAGRGMPSVFSNIFANMSPTATRKWSHNG
jgi:hypothetical protein